MSIVSIVCFSLDLFILLTCIPKKSDPFSPGRVFGFVWAFAVGLADLKLSHLQSSWSAYAWSVILLAVGAFLSGNYVVYVLNIKKVFASIQQMRLITRQTEVRDQRFFIAIVLVFFVYIVSYLAESMILGYIPIFSDRPDRARVEFGVFGLHLLVNTLPLILFMIVEYLIFVRGNAVKKRWLMLIFTISSLTFALMLQRFDFTVAALLIIAFTYYSSNYIRPKNVLIVAALFSVLLIAIQSVRLTAYVQNYIYVVSFMKYSPQYAFLTEPYMYIVMNFENFARGIDKLEYFTFGYFTADFLLALSGLKHWLANYFHIVERPFIISGYNTYPLFWTYFYDFGIVGIAFASFILGGIISSMYYLMRSRPSIITIGVYSFAFYIIVISFFTNPLTMLKTNFNIALWLIIHYMVTKNSLSRKVVI